MFPFNDSVYKWFKWLAAIVLPALAALAGTIGLVVGFDKTDVVVTIIAAVGTFIGALVGVSSAAYNKAQKVNVSASKPLSGKQPDDPH